MPSHGSPYSSQRLPERTKRTIARMVARGKLRCDISKRYHCGYQTIAKIVAAYGNGTTKPPLRYAEYAAAQAKPNGGNGAAHEPPRLSSDAILLLESAARAISQRPAGALTTAELYCVLAARSLHHEKR
jgi:hypothetical protein